jgi:hypothetical protein
MIIPRSSLDSLGSVIDQAGAHVEPTKISALLARAMDDLPYVTESTDLWLPIRRLAPLGSEIEAHHGLESRKAFAAALIGHLALRLAERLPSMNLPNSILELYPAAFERLAAHLTGADLTSYWCGDDEFLKDVRIAGGYSVPCGAQDVDLYSTISRLSGVKSMLKERDFRNGWLVALRGGSPWFSIHTDQRHTEDFNEAGWERCYRRIAQLLVKHPEVKGMVGTSWFYDPQLLTISPRLAYLQTTPIANGAFVVRHGPGAIHTERATVTSPTRRALVEQGRYVPICCSLLWPRKELLHWARLEES